MGNQMESLFTIGGCATILFIIAWAKQSEWLMDFVIRMVYGVLAIMVVNYLLQKAGVNIVAELNLFVVLTSGILGFPGVLALYGIIFYKSL